MATTDDPGTTIARPGTTGDTRPVGTSATAVPTSEVPPSTSSTTAASSSTTTAASPASSTTTTTRPSGGANSTTIPLPSGQSIPPGNTPEEKAWCTQAKPVSQALQALFTLNQGQLENLVNQALALKATAPAALQPPLGILADVGGRFLAAVQAGQAKITESGIVAWANVNLTPAQQQEFLQAAGSVTGYINATC